MAKIELTGVDKMGLGFYKSYKDENGDTWFDGEPFPDDECSNCEHDIGADLVCYWRGKGAGVFCVECVAISQEVYH